MVLKASFRIIYITLLTIVCLHNSAQSDDSVVPTTYNRELVNANEYPWRAIGRVQWANTGKRSSCTGVLIGKRVVLTAAHCLYSSAAGKWVDASEIHFLAGYAKGEFVAHSTGQEAFAAADFKPELWDHPSNWQHDWALIYLEKPIGEKIGYLGWRTFKFNDKNKNILNRIGLKLAGYPIDRQHLLSVEKNCTIKGFGGEEIIYLDGCNTTYSDSGGPLIISKNGRLTVIGITSLTNNGDIENLNSAISLGAFSGTIRTLLEKEGSLGTTDAPPLAYGWSPADDQ